jgi:hypothetical protein
MVAPNYAKQRSELAKSLGLGQLRRNPAPIESEADAASGADAEADRKPRAARRKAA